MAAVGLVPIVVPVTLAFVFTHSSPGALSGRTPGDAGLEYREVVVQTPDGVQLAGWYIPAHNRAAILTIPGGGNTRDGVLDQSVVLARHGYGVLDLDPRGHGLSQGSPMDLGWYGELDIAGAMAFLERQPNLDVGRIGALGLSMGGEEALTAAAVDTGIRAVVNEGGSNRVLTDTLPIADRDPIVRLQLPFYWIWLSATERMTSATPPMPLADAMRRIAPRPVLMIGSSDPPEPIVMPYLTIALGFVASVGVHLVLMNVLQVWP